MELCPTCNRPYDNFICICQLDNTTVKDLARTINTQQDFFWKPEFCTSLAKFLLGTDD